MRGLAGYRGNIGEKRKFTPVSPKPCRMAANYDRVGENKGEKGLRRNGKGGCAVKGPEMEIVLTVIWR
jgi:hypothetical protein